MILYVIYMQANAKGRKVASQFWEGQEQFRQGYEGWQRQMPAAHHHLDSYEEYEHIKKRNRTLPQIELRFHSHEEAHLSTSNGRPLPSPAMIGKGNGGRLAGAAAAGKGFSGGWPAGPKPCDSCKESPAVLFCRADSAFLCAACDGKVHGANKLASRHERVRLCEVCERSPAIVTCKADAASLCAACDANIHSANPLASRHQRLPVAPFFDSPGASLFDDGGGGVEVAEEAEAASWLLPNPKISEAAAEFKSGELFFSDVDPYLELDYDSPIEHKFGGYNNAAMDSVVPVQTDHTAYFDAGVGDYHRKSNPPSHTYTAPSLSHSMSSSSSLEVGVVPDGGDTAPAGGSGAAAQLTGVEREARVLRYREKRKNRRFEKTIRYASRKAYAETRPRIKGRFAKRVAGAADAARIFSAAGYRVVPSF